MELRELRVRAATALAAVPRDWRRYAPSAGSAAAHVVVFLGLGAMMAVSPPRLRTAKPPPPPTLTVELVSTDVAPPRPAPKAAAPADAAPLPPRRKAERSPASRPAPLPDGEPVTTAENDVEAIPLPQSPSAVPPGLKRLLEINPCDDHLEKQRSECNLQWGRLADQAQRGYSPTIEQLAALYPRYEPDDPSIPEWAPVAMALLNSFVRMSIADAAGPAPAMQGGPGGGTGIENITTRLAKPIPDPVFDTDMPQWLGFDHPTRLPQAREKN